MRNKPLILIADDTTENLQVLGSMLKNKGYNIAAVTNGEEVLDFVAKRKPALILLDVMMPRLNGYEACRKLKSDDNFDDIPVLFISALNELEDKLAGFKAGGVDFITKPFQRQEVLARVKTHLSLQENKEKVVAYARQLEERNEELEELQRELNKEWTKGKQLHQKFLPRQLPSTEKLDTCVYYQASKKLGGDFYNFIEIGDKIIAYVVDITGHGLDGALLNIFIRETINSFLEQQELDLKKLLRFIYRKYAKESFSDDYFICIALIVLDKNNMDLYYLNSGFQFNPLVVNRQGVEEIDARGLPISTAIDLEKYEFDYVKVELKLGDKFIIMTDGLVEENNNYERYGFGKVKKIGKQNKLLPITSLLEEMKKDFHSFKGAVSAQDDITILGLEHKLEVQERKELEVFSSLNELDEIKKELDESITSYCSETDKILIAVHEILVNAIEHGNLEDKEKNVIITIEKTVNYLQVAIEDEGIGFDWKNILQEQELYDNWEDCGRGLRIAELAVDSIYYNELGNKVFLLKMF